MALLFFYLPFLIVIPFLLIAGIFLVVVPGGDIILFIGAYSTAVGIAQLGALAEGDALRGARARRARSARADAAYALLQRNEVAADPQRLGAVLHQAGPTR